MVRGSDIETRNFLLARGLVRGSGIELGTSCQVGDVELVSAAGVGAASTEDASIMFSDLALDTMTMKPWSRVEEGSREGAPVRTNILSSWRTSAGEEVGSRRLAPQGSRWEREKGSRVDSFSR